MNDILVFGKILAVLFYLLSCNENVCAQLSLQETNWSGDAQLSFTHDSLMVSDVKTKKLICTFLYIQKDDTLFVANADKVAHCGAGSGIYRIQYQRRGQQVSFTTIRDSCVERKSLLILPLLFAFIYKQGEAARDWSFLDPEADSIAGTSLYKAYALLKGRASTQVIVAVIDNGVDIEHRDLKDVIWTNTKEIPGNGVDDDHNGYVDDTHGWNFRGTKDGTIVENE